VAIDVGEVAGFAATGCKTCNLTNILASREAARGQVLAIQSGQAVEIIMYAANTSIIESYN